MLPWDTQGHPLLVLTLNYQASCPKLPWDCQGSTSPLTNSRYQLSQVAMGQPGNHLTPPCQSQVLVVPKFSWDIQVSTSPLTYGPYHPTPCPDNPETPRHLTPPCQSQILSCPKFPYLDAYDSRITINDDIAQGNHMNSQYIWSTT